MSQQSFRQGQVVGHGKPRAGHLVAPEPHLQQVVAGANTGPYRCFDVFVEAFQLPLYGSDGAQLLFQHRHLPVIALGREPHLVFGLAVHEPVFLDVHLGQPVGVGNLSAGEYRLRGRHPAHDAVFHHRHSHARCDVEAYHSLVGHEARARCVYRGEVVGEGLFAPLARHVQFVGGPFCARIVAQRHFHATLGREPVLCRHSAGLPPRRYRGGGHEQSVCSFHCHYH